MLTIYLPSDCEVVSESSSTLNRNVRNSSAVRDVSSPHYNDAKEVAGKFPRMMNPSKSCIGDPTVLVDVPEMSGRGRCGGWMCRALDDTGEVDASKFRGMRGNGYVDLETSVDARDEHVKAAWDATWCGAAFATPDDYAVHVADVLNGIEKKHGEMGLRHTVVLTPHTVDVGGFNNLDDVWLDADVLGFETVVSTTSSNYVDDNYSFTRYHIRLRDSGMEQAWVGRVASTQGCCVGHLCCRQARA